MIRCLVIEDEPLAAELIADHLKKSSGFELSASFTNPIEAIEYLNTNPIDLIFLDVQMPEITGIQFMRIVNKSYPIIMTTAYEQYAVEGFDFDVIDYLLKPISYDRFQVAINKFKERKSGYKAKQRDEQNSDIIFVRSEYKTIRISIGDIYYIQGFGDYVIIHCEGGKKYTLETLKYLEELLPPQQFMRVHKSYIIALNKINFIERNEISVADTIIPIGETYRKTFWNRIAKNS
ncbi:MAG: response regulator transcription factor [Calditrichaeota bacterium]|nr:response regulator transcription factor [Calditrichota bacterium]